MHEIKADLQKNRLYVKLKGFMTNDELKQASEEIIQKIMLLKPGFHIMTDISEFSPVSADGVEYIKRAQIFAFQHGARKVVRVVKNLLGSMQFKRVQKEAHVTYQIIEVGSLEEAERLLDEEG